MDGGTLPLGASGAAEQRPTEIGWLVLVLMLLLRHWFASRGGQRVESIEGRIVESIKGVVVVVVVVVSVTRSAAALAAAVEGEAVEVGSHGDVG